MAGGLVAATAGTNAFARFDPSFLSGLAARMRVSALTGQTAGAGVSSAAFQTGGITMAQGTAGSRPVFTTGGLGGRSYLLFDGSDDYLESTAAYSLAQPFTLALLLNVTSVSGAREFAHSESGVDFSINTQTATSYDLYAGGTSTGAGTSVTGMQMLTWIYNGASSSVSYNTTVKATGSVGSNGLGSALSLGRHKTASRYAAMHLYEVLIYSRALAAAEIAQLSTYQVANYS